MAVTDKTLESYEMDSILDYYAYIIDSITNGNKTQAKELFNDLTPDDGMQSKGQQSYFYDYAHDMGHDVDELKLFFKPKKKLR
jgi:hypothetical protein